MHYIVLDMEWNQAGSYEAIVQTPVYLKGEIVQIGAVKLNESLEQISAFNILVKPRYYKRMNPRVRRLTGITDADLQRGTPLGMAISSFRRFCGSDAVFLTWGGEDAPMLRDNLKMYGIPSDWLPETYDLQPIFYDQISQEKHRFSLEDAVVLVGEAPYEAHDALNDAKSTALICHHLRLREGLADYGRICSELRTRLTEPLSTCPSDRFFSEEAQKCYSTRREALEDPENSVYCCPTCGGTVRFDAWLCQSTVKFVKEGVCECGAECYIRLRFRKNEDGTFQTSRSAYPMTEERREFLQKLRRKQAEKLARWNAVPHGSDEAGALYDVEELYETGESVAGG